MSNTWTIYMLVQGQVWVKLNDVEKNENTWSLVKHWIPCPRKTNLLFSKGKAQNNNRYASGNNVQQGQVYWQRKKMVNKMTGTAVAWRLPLTLWTIFSYLRWSPACDRLYILVDTVMHIGYVSSTTIMATFEWQKIKIRTCQVWWSNEVCTLTLSMNN